ncbi:helix-turn-helix domain-containing protein [Pullulanibacillus camelliae]|nr:helix-turn-helix domain-containing protein [Pullulanibacillus camelliae]
MDSKRLGKEIKYLRKEKGINQKELAEGICTQSAISQIESGEIFPRIDTLYYLAAKLRVSIDFFLSILFHEKHNYINNTKAYIQMLSNKKQYDELYFFSKNELKNNKLHSEYHQFLLWHYFMSSYYLKKINYSQCINELKKLITLASIHEKYELIDLKIMNAIANLHAENEDYTSSIEIHNKIISMEDIPEEEFYKLKIKVLYNKSKTLFKIGDTKLSLKSCEDAYKISTEKESLFLLGQIFFQKGQCLEKFTNTDISLIKECYKNSLIFLEIFKMDYYINIIKKEKQQYLCS